MYFEFDDSRRIHQPYTDNFTRQPVWKAPPYNTPILNWKRGIYAWSTAVLLVEPLNHFTSHVNLLNQFYEWPKTRSEYNIFFKEVFRMPDFWPEMFKKVAFGLVAGAGDVGLKLAAWQYIYGGTTSPQEYADYNSFKPLLCGIEAFVPTALTGVPFETARRAYYADKSWPVELRKGYTSPLNALLRIPFEEGLGYLFKGGFPIWASSLTFWLGYTTMYSYLKNKLFFFWVYQDFNYNWCKFLMMGTSFVLASLMSYPLYFTRTMVDLWPKERGGHCTWNNNYRQCAKWMIENMDQLGYNFIAGYAQWFKRYGISYSIALWMADNLGMFSNVNDSWGNIEGQFPISAESV